MGCRMKTKNDETNCDAAKKTKKRITQTLMIANNIKVSDVTLQNDKRNMMTK